MIDYEKFKQEIQVSFPNPVAEMFFELYPRLEQLGILPFSKIIIVGLSHLYESLENVAGWRLANMSSAVMVEVMDGQGTTGMGFMFGVKADAYIGSYPPEFSDVIQTLRSKLSDYVIVVCEIVVNAERLTDLRCAV